MGKNAFDSLSDLIETVESVSTDPDWAGFLGTRNKPDSVSDSEHLWNRVAVYAPKILKKQEGIAKKLLAAVNGMTAEEYEEKVSETTLLADLFKLATDSKIQVLFTLAQIRAASSGSAQENTQAQET